MNNKEKALQQLIEIKKNRCKASVKIKSDMGILEILPSAGIVDEILDNIISILKLQ